MSLCNCGSKCSCTLAALIISAVIGIIGAFLQITGVLVLTPVFLAAGFIIAAALLGLLILSASLRCRVEISGCSCGALNASLAGVLGTLLLSAIQLAVGITATSVISAILTGLLLFSFALALSSAACYVRHLSGCGD